MNCLPPACLSLLLIGLMACQGEITSAQSRAAAQGRGPSAAKGTADPKAEPGAGDPSLPGAPGTKDQDPLRHERFLSAPGIRRLTKLEYAESVGALTGLSPAQILPPAELVVEGHSRIAGAQKIGYDDVDRFLSLGDGLAQAAAATLAKEASCAQDIACQKAWAKDFLDLAFRHPVPPGVATGYEAMFEDAEASFEQKLVSFLGAVFSSPLFLYRVEAGQEHAGVHLLSDHEIATRLSFLVWGRGPDRELLKAATAQELRTPQGRLRELRRLWASPQARVGVRAFVADWMAATEANVASKDASVLQGTPQTLNTQIKESFDRSVDHVIFEGSGRLADLIDSAEFVADADVAALLGRQVKREQGWIPVSLPREERLGLLTHPMTLAAHTKESGTSPFPMGAFVYENILCEITPPPPPMQALDEEALTEGSTLRQALEAITQAPVCANCHVRIGPSGFTFLPFDPIGRYDANDSKGRPYDTAGVIPIGADMLEFAGVSGMAQGLADHPATSKCVARRLFRWTFGRFETLGDEAFLLEMESLAVAGRAQMLPLLEELVASPLFAQTTPQKETP